jgi:hypothetical protein
MRTCPYSIELAAGSSGDLNLVDLEQPSLNSGADMKYGLFCSANARPVSVSSRRVAPVTRTATVKVCRRQGAAPARSLTVARFFRCVLCLSGSIKGWGSRKGLRRHQPVGA